MSISKKISEFFILPKQIRSALINFPTKFPTNESIRSKNSKSLRAINKFLKPEKKPFEKKQEQKEILLQNLLNKFSASKKATRNAAANCVGIYVDNDIDQLNGVLTDIDFHANRVDVSAWNRKENLGRIAETTKKLLSNKKIDPEFTFNGKVLHISEPMGSRLERVILMTSNENAFASVALHHNRIKTVLGVGGLQHEVFAKYGKAKPETPQFSIYEKYVQFLDFKPAFSQIKKQEAPKA